MSSSAVAGGTLAASATGAGAPALGDQSTRHNPQHHHQFAHARTRSQTHSRHNAEHRTRRASQPASHGPRPPSFLSAATTTESLHSQPGAPILQLSRKFVARRISEGETGRLKEELKCQACGKGYKHVSSLAKHLWEHTPEWNLTSKLLISKHQQVQLLEAASILVSMNEEDENVPGSNGENDESANTTAVDESVDNDDSELSSRETVSSNTSPGQETALSSESSPDADGDGDERVGVDADGDVDVGADPNVDADADADGERISKFIVGHNSGRTIHKTPRRKSHLYSASPVVGSVLASDDGHQPPRASRRRSTFTRPRTLFGSQLHPTEIPENSVFELDD